VLTSGSPALLVQFEVDSCPPVGGAFGSERGIGCRGRYLEPNFTEPVDAAVEELGDAEDDRQSDQEH
jgi:hypothetical protein